MVLDFGAFTTAIVTTTIIAEWKPFITASIAIVRIANANAINSTINWNIIDAVVIAFIDVITNAGAAIISL
jgi:hypothetical protein